MSDLERAQEWLGCKVIRDDLTGDAWCDVHPVHNGWPCSEATGLAALLAETRADEARRIRDALLEAAEKDYARGLKEPSKAQRMVADWITRGLSHV